jgi:hypothetical protein
VSLDYLSLFSSFDFEYHHHTRCHNLILGFPQNHPFIKKKIKKQKYKNEKNEK